MKDTILYEKLDISPELSDEEIKKIGKKLLLKYHPDKNENKEESSKKFIEVKEILDILTDKEKRQLYHNIGISILNNSNDSSNVPSNINPEHIFNSPFFNNFNSLFSNFTKMNGDLSSFMGMHGIKPGMSTFNNKNYSSDITYRIKINRNFIREDQEYNVYYKRVVVCNSCNLSGVPPIICEKCNNKRFIQTTKVFNNIIIKERIICNDCYDKDKKCVKCNGNEYTEEDKKVILNIKRDKIIDLIDKKQSIILKEHGNILKDKN